LLSPQHPLIVSAQHGLDDDSKHINNVASRLSSPYPSPVSVLTLYTSRMTPTINHPVDIDGSRDSDIAIIIDSGGEVGSSNNVNTSTSSRDEYE
jgi:hypothetical protein